MKKHLAKLNLSRETLRTLESPALTPVGGGDEAPTILPGPIGTKAAAPTLLPTCQTYCDLTLGCRDITGT